MKGLAYPILAAAVICTTVPSASAKPIEFRGAVCVTAVNAACLAEGIDVGCGSTLRFTPPNLNADSGPATRVSYFSTFFAENYTLASGNLVGTKFKTVTGTAVGRSGFNLRPQ